MSLPSTDGSGDSADIGSGDGMDSPTALVPTTADDDDNGNDDDTATSSNNRMYSNSGLTYPSDKEKQQSSGSTISTGQKVGYSILLLVACTLGIASVLIVYRQQRRKHQQHWTKQVKSNFSWIRWGIIHDDEKYHTKSMKNSIITNTSKRRAQNPGTIYVTSSASSSSSSCSENEKLTSKFRNEI